METLGPFLAEVLRRSGVTDLDNDPLGIVREYDLAEDRELVLHGECRLHVELRRLERTTAVKAGGVAAGWVFLAVLLGWLDRLSRGYMTTRLRVIGILGGVLMPAALFLV